MSGGRSKSPLVIPVAILAASVLYLAYSGSGGGESPDRANPSAVPAARPAASKDAGTNGAPGSGERGSAPAAAIDPGRGVTPEQFEAQIEEARARIPRTQDLQKLSAEEVHHTPALIVRASIALGGLAQAVHDNPALAPQAMEFYSQCAGEESYPASVRALCYSHLSGSGLAAPANVPDEVKRLAARIPSGE